MTMNTEVQFLWNRFTLREALLLGFCATFIVLTKATLRMKLGISGHSMFFMVFFLLLSRGCVKKTGAATLVALVAAGLSMALGMAGKGPLKLLNFLLPALLIDGIGIILPRLPTNYLLCLVIGALAGTTKSVHSALLEYLAGVPADIFMKKAALEGFFGGVFGMLGALPVPAIIRKLQINRLIPESAGKASGNGNNKQTGT